MSKAELLKQKITAALEDKEITLEEVDEERGCENPLDQDTRYRLLTPT